jgi:hypothetical protein
MLMQPDDVKTVEINVGITQRKLVFNRFCDGSVLINVVNKGETVEGYCPSDRKVSELFEFFGLAEKERKAYKNG